MEPNLPGITEKGKFGGGQRNFVNADAGEGRRLIDANSVPVNFQVGHNADTSRAWRNFPGQIGDHRAREARGKAHVFNLSNPLSLSILRFHIRRYYLDARLVCGEHRSRGEVIGVAIEEQAQRLLWIPFAEVEFNPVQFGEACERQVFEAGDVLAIAFGESRQNIVAVVVPRTLRNTRIPRSDYAKFREWGSADEPLVRIDFDAGGVVDRNEPHPIEVDGLFHGLHEAKAEPAVFWLGTLRRHFQIFVGIWDVTFTGSDPVADDAGPNHVGNELVLLAIPGKENGTRTATAVKLADALRFLGNKVDFVLRHAGRPEQAHGVDNFLRAQPNEQGSRVLAEVPGSTGDFPFLVERARIDLDLCADGALVVVRANIFENDGCAFFLGNHDVGTSPAVQISNRERARLAQLQAIELRVFRDVGPSRVTLVAEEADFAAVRAFADGDKVEPAVIVKIDPAYAPALLPLQIW